MKILVEKAESFEGPAYQYKGEDGMPRAIIVPVLLATGVDGKRYQLPNGVCIKYDEDGFQMVKLHYNLDKANEMTRIICDQGFINGVHWVEVTERDMQEYLKHGYGLAA